MKVNEEKEKTPDNLFNNFIEEKTQLKNNLKETIFPDYLSDLWMKYLPFLKIPEDLLF